MPNLPIATIKTDGGTQSREAINESHARSLADDIEAGDTLPPITVFYDGALYWLADGFHRVLAHKILKKQTIAADVHQGSCRDAILYSVGVNGKHGLKRTNADKHRAVLRLLSDEEWSQWSSHAIARQCNVSAMTVSRLRKDQVSNGSNKLGELEKRKYADGKGQTRLMQVPPGPKKKVELEPLAAVGATVKTESGKAVITRTHSGGNIYECEVPGQTDSVYLRRCDFTVVAGATLPVVDRVPISTDVVTETLAPAIDIEGYQKLLKACLRLYESGNDWTDEHYNAVVSACS